MDNSETKDNSNNIVEVRSAKQLYDEKILATLVGNDFPPHLQNLCINSEVYKLDRYGTREQRPTLWTGKECKNGIAMRQLALCEWCIAMKYKRNEVDEV